MVSFSSFAHRKGATYICWTRVVGVGFVLGSHTYFCPVLLYAETEAVSG